MPSDPKAKWRVRLAFLLLFVVFAAGVYYARELGKLREGMAARESQRASQGAPDAKPTVEPLIQHAQERFLPLLAVARKTTGETDAAMESLSGEIAPPGILKTIDFFASASQRDLEALQRDLKTAEANATTFLPRYVALLNAEHDILDKYARANADRGTAARFLASIDKRDADITAFTSKMLSARADYYRAYENYVAFLAREWGAYKIDKGQFVFPLQYTYSRYNAVAGPMTVAANRVGELEQEGKNLLMSQQAQWTEVGGK